MASPRPLVVRAIALAMLAALGASGCASLGKPAWLEPGPARSQRRRARRRSTQMAAHRPRRH